MEEIKQQQQEFPEDNTNEIERFVISKILELFKDNHIPSQVNDISPEIKEKIKNLLLTVDEKSRLKVAKEIALHNVRELSKYVDAYGIDSEKDRSEIAEFAAALNGRRVTKNIDKYQINDEEFKLKIASVAAEQNGEGASMYVQNYQFESRENRETVLRIALLNDPNTILYFQNYYPELNIQKIKYNPQIKDIQEWLRLNIEILKHIFPSAVLNVYSDMKRRDAGIKLLTGYIGHSKDFPTNENSSRKALKNITGFPVEMISTKEPAESTKGDLYELLLELQTKCPEPCFTGIEVSQDLFSDSKLTKIISFLNQWNMFMQLHGSDSKVAYSTVRESLNEFANGGTLSLNSENIGIATQQLNQIFSRDFKNTINRFSGEFLEEKDIQQLIEKWGDISVFLTLAARFNGNAIWRKEISTLVDIVKHVIHNTYEEYKYFDQAALLKKEKLPHSQINFLSGEELLSWMQNPSRLAVNTPKSLNKSEEETLKSAIVSLKQLISNEFNSENGGLTDENDEIDIVKISDKNLQKHLKKTFGSDTRAMFDYCLSLASRIVEGDNLKIAVSRIKSIKDIFALDSDSKNKLDEISKSLAKKRESQSILFTLITDDPLFLLSVGNLVDSSSCQNYKNGNQIQTIPGYVMDANTKLLASFVIGPNNDFGYKQFAEVCKVLNSDSQSIHYQFDAPRKLLTIKCGEKLYNIKLEKAFSRQVLKLGLTKSGKNGLKTEPEFFQTNNSMENLRNEAKLLLDDFCKTFNAVDNEPTVIKKTKNIEGTYSDSAGGLQKDDYLIK